MFTHLQSSLFKNQVTKQQQQAQAAAQQARPASVARTIAAPAQSHHIQQVTTAATPSQANSFHSGSISQQNVSYSSVAPSPARAGSMGQSLQSLRGGMTSSSVSSSIPSSAQYSQHEQPYQLDELDRAFLASLRRYGPIFSELAQCDAWKQLCRPGHLQRQQARETKERPTIRAASFISSPPPPPPASSHGAAADAGGAAGAAAEHAWPRRLEVDFEPIGLHADREQVLAALAKDGTLVVTLAPAAAVGAAALNANTQVSLKLDEPHRCARSFSIS